MDRDGVRSAKPDLMWAARAKFSKLWAVRHHPAYRELNMHDLMQRLQVPPELNGLIDRTMSLNMTGTPHTREGPDFHLEKINKRVQGFLPLASKDEDWKRVCNNVDSLD